MFTPRSQETRHDNDNARLGRAVEARRGVEMNTKSLKAVFSALVVATALGLTTGAASAQSVMKQCGDEWKAAKANNATNGQTWQEFLKGCRAQKASASAPAAAPAAAPAPAPAPAAAPPPPAPAPVQASLPKPAPLGPAARATGAGEFTTEGEAKARCPTDTVVWVNTKSKIYHYAGTRSYGTTKQGAYMCEADASAAGDRASKSKIKKAAGQQ
jgi:hypothetical protein